MLSSRGQGYAGQFDIPWRFALSATYDAETNPEGLISFAVAEQVLMRKELEDFAKKVDLPYDQVFAYKNTSAGGKRFPVALAVHLNEYFSPCSPVTADDIKVTDAATSLHEALAFSLADPGDGILLSRPYYGRLELDFGNRAGVKVVPVDTQPEEAFERGVVGKYEEALRRAGREGTRVRAMEVVNPHNPLGCCYPRSTLISLMRFCNSHNLHFISDEVYALSMHASSPNITPFTSALSIDPEGIIDRNLVHVEYGMSKDFGAGGLKLGALITKNPDLKAAVMANIRFHNPSGASLAIASAMLEDRKWCRDFISLSRRRIAEAYDPWLDGGLGHGESEFELAQKFVDGGVFLQPGEEYAIRPGWFRLVFTMERDVVEEGLRRVERVLKNIENRRH